MTIRSYGIVLSFVLAASAGLLSAPIPAPKETRSPQEIEAAREDLRLLRRRAMDPKISPAELWKFWQEFRLRHSGSAESTQAAELMRTATSPLDKLDRTQIPAADCPKWLPKEVVAVLGENRGRDWSETRLVAVSPDGKRIASCTFDSVRLWDSATMGEREAILVREETRRHQGELGYPLAAAFSADGRLLAIAHLSGVIVWDVSGKGPKLRAINRCGEFAHSLRFTQEGQALLWAGSNSLKRWEFNDSEEAQGQGSYPEEAQRRFFQYLAPNKRWLVTGERKKDANYYLWDLDNPDKAGKALGVLKGHLAFAPDSNKIAFVTTNKDVRLWDLSGKESKRGKLLANPLRGEGRVTWLRFSPDGEVLARVDEMWLSLWPLAEGKRKELGIAPRETHRAIPLPNEVNDMVYLPDGKALVLGGKDGTVRLWDIASDQERFPLIGHRGRVTEIAFAPNGGALVSSGDDGTIRWWDLQGHRPKTHLLADKIHAEQLVFAPQGGYLAVLGRGMQLWDVSGASDGKAAELKTSTNPFENLERKLVGIAFSPNGKLIATTGTKPSMESPTIDVPEVRLWDFKDGTFQESDSLVLPTKDAEDVKHISLSGSPLFTADSKNLVFAAWERWRLWDLTASRAQNGPQINYPIFAGEYTFTSGGRAADLEGVPSRKNNIGFTISARVWDIAAAGLHDRSRVLFGDSIPRELIFSLDGRKMASIDEKDRLVIWDVDSGRKEQEINLPGHVAMMSFAPDGRHLATANANGTIYIYRLANPTKTHEK